MLEGATVHQMQVTREAIGTAATDPTQVSARVALAKSTAQLFAEVGAVLHLSGHIVGPDRKLGASPLGHGSDETVAISLLLRIASQLISASTDLFVDGRTYAAAALIRQMVEIEYLAWAFETRNHDAERWLRSSKDEREEFFAPAKLRKAAGDQFRSKDYGYHCELGGHPVPASAILLDDHVSLAQMLLVDSLGHAGRIWDHLVRWASLQNEPFILKCSAEVSSRFADWKSKDALVDLLAVVAESNK